MIRKTFMRKKNCLEHLLLHMNLRQITKIIIINAENGFKGWLHLWLHLWGLCNDFLRPLIFRLHGWKEEHLLDVVGVGQEHCKPVNAHAPPASGWKSIFQGCAEVFIHEHCFVIATCLKWNVHFLVLLSMLDSYTAFQPFFLWNSLTLSVACCSNIALWTTGSFSSV